MTTGAGQKGQADRQDVAASKRKRRAGESARTVWEDAGADRQGRVCLGLRRRRHACRARLGVLEQRYVPPEYLQGRNVAEQFRDVLDCFSGDTGLVAPDIFENDFALAAFLEEIAVKRVVTIKLAPAERRT